MNVNELREKVFSTIKFVNTMKKKIFRMMLNNIITYYTFKITEIVVGDSVDDVEKVDIAKYKRIVELARNLEKELYGDNVNNDTITTEEPEHTESKPDVTEKPQTEVKEPVSKENQEEA